MSRWSVLALLAFAACRADREAPIPEPPKPEAPQLEPSEQPEAPPPQAGSEEASFRHIDVKTLKQRLDEGWDPFVLDVRGPEEVAAASLPFTDRVEPHAGVARIAAELPRDRDIVVFCKTGRRSAIAAQALINAGFDPARVHSVAGGITAWSQHVDPSVPRY